jgi:hypothetical protein
VPGVEFTKLNLWIVPSIRSEYRQVVLCTYTKQRPYSSKMYKVGAVEPPYPNAGYRDRQLSGSVWLFG